MGGGLTACVGSDRLAVESGDLANWTCCGKTKVGPKVPKPYSRDGGHADIIDPTKDCCSEQGEDFVDHQSTELSTEARARRSKEAAVALLPPRASKAGSTLNDAGLPPMFGRQSSSSSGSHARGRQGNSSPPMAVGHRPSGPGEELSKQLERRRSIHSGLESPRESPSPRHRIEAAVPVMEPTLARRMSQQQEKLVGSRRSIADPLITKTSTERTRIEPTDPALVKRFSEQRSKESGVDSPSSHPSSPRPPQCPSPYLQTA